ncbi:MAG: hypothetical protein Kow0069_00900 [Promethearchaeota archaeon]
MNLELVQPAGNQLGSVALGNVRVPLSDPLTIISIKSANTSKALNLLTSCPHVRTLDQLTHSLAFPSMIECLVRGDPQTAEFLELSRDVLGIKSEMVGFLDGVRKLGKSLKILISRKTYLAAVETINEELKRVEEELGASQLQEVRAEINALEDSERKLRESVERHERVVKKLDPELRDSRLRWERLHAELSSTSERLAKVKREIKKLFAEINARTRRIAHLDLEQEEAQIDGRDEDSKQISERLARLQAERRKFLTESKEMKAQASSLERRLVDLRRRHDAAEAKYFRIKEQREQSEETRQSDAASLTSVREKLAALREKMGTETAEIREHLRPPTILHEILDRLTTAKQFFERKLKKLDATLDLNVDYGDLFDECGWEFRGTLNKMRKLLPSYGDLVIPWLLRAEAWVQSLGDEVEGALEVEHLMFPPAVSIRWSVQGSGVSTNSVLRLTPLFALIREVPVAVGVVVPRDTPPYDSMNFLDEMKKLVKVLAEEEKPKGRVVLFVFDEKLATTIAHAGAEFVEVEV